MKTVTFGEIMLRLSPPGYERFVQADSFDATFGGGEANVAVSLANYGLESYFVTKLPENEIGEAGELDEAGYADLARQLKEEYGFETVAITLRESFSASKNGWSAMLCDERDCREPYRSGRYEIDLVDRVGGGDSFAGGLIYGLLTREDTREAVEFAAAASCLKQTIPGDFNLSSVEEVEQLAQGSGSGRVQR